MLRIAQTRWTARPILITLLLVPVSWAGSPWPQPVGRNSDSREADLIGAMIQRLMFDDAAEICGYQQRRSDPQSDPSAMWAIRLSQVLTKQQMLADRFDDQAVAAAQKPVVDLLGSYPDHPRALFLEAQKLAVRREAARHAVFVASVSPTSNQQIDRVFTNLARVSRDLNELAETVDSAHAAIDSNAKNLRQRSLASDLVRLHQELLIEVVSTSLLQTELFSAGGRDCIAAANKAQQAADQALRQLPPDTPARIEIERLRVQAILRSGQYDQAASQLDQLMRWIGKPFPPNIQALKLRLDIARDRLNAAAETIEAYYGGGNAAPKSVDMDLARLEFLLANQDPRVGKWIDQIERRNGVFARRRAEAIALSSLRSSGTAKVVDASIIAAQGQDWLRRGNPKRAGELLAAAARAEQTPDRAITRATEAAAAFIAAQQNSDAAKILAEVAKAKPTGENAALAHLQAAHLYAAEKKPDAASTVEAVLRTTIKQWPESNESDQARSWLIRLLRSQDRIHEAAVTATSIPAAKATPQRLDVAVDLWIAAVRSCQADQVNGLGREFLDAVAELRAKSPSSHGALRRAAAVVLDEEWLVRLDDAESAKVDQYSDKLLAFRQTNGLATLPDPPEHLRNDSVWRLMRDGRRNQLIRRRNASTIGAWPSQSAETLDHIERLIWLGNVGPAVAMAQSLSKKSKSPGKTLTGAARLLGSSQNREAMTQAVALWDQLAAGIPKGTPVWHDAKIQAIKLLAAIGQHEQASKRARFVLLTSAPEDASTRRQYESLAKSAAAKP